MHTHTELNPRKEYQEKKKIFSLLKRWNGPCYPSLYINAICFLPINRVLIDFLAKINTELSNIILWRHPYKRSHLILIAFSQKIPFLISLNSCIYNREVNKMGSLIISLEREDWQNLQNISPWSIHFLIWFSRASSASLFVWFDFRWYIFFSKLSALSMCRLFLLVFGIARNKFTIQRIIGKPAKKTGYFMTSCQRVGR